MKRTLLLAGLPILVAFMTGVTVPPVSAHPSGEDSVDDGEIRYDEGTVYDVALAHGITVWNERKEIAILPDNIINVEDVYFSDVDQPDIPNCGWYDNNFSSDDIYFNKAALGEPAGTFMQTLCAAHEIRHALGIAHNGNGNLMDDDAQPEAFDTPQCHDKEDYRDLWGGPSGPCANAANSDRVTDFNGDPLRMYAAFSRSFGSDKCKLSTKHTLV